MFSNTNDNTFEERKSPPLATTPTLPQQVKIIDLNSPEARSLLLENLKRIASPHAEKQRPKKGKSGRSIKVPPSFRVQYSLANDDCETMMIEAVPISQQKCT